MRNDLFASAGYTAGQLNAMVKLLKKQAGENGPRRFLRGEVQITEPASKWREENGVVYFSVVSDGATGPEWISRMGNPRNGESVHNLLLSCAIDWTEGVVYNIAVLKGPLFEDFEDNDRNLTRIKMEGSLRGFRRPSAEVSCLIREKFTDEDIKAMGLYSIITMHNPINSGLEDQVLLSAGLEGGGGCLTPYVANHPHNFSSDYGFAFVVSEVSLNE